MITEHNHPDQLVKPSIQIQSPAKELEETINQNFLDEFNRSYGIYGHLVNIENTTNLDLIYVVSSLPSFKVLSVKPEIKGTTERRIT